MGWALVFIMASGLGRIEADLVAAGAKPAASPGVTQWVIAYDVPEDDVKSLDLTLSYRFWDVNVDGDVPTTRVLFTGSVKLAPGHAKVSITISLDAKKSEILIDGVPVKSLSGKPGKGFPLDASSAIAAVPKPNANGFYVLAQKSIDPKKPVAMGDTDEASSWIDLEIDPKL